MQMDPIEIQYNIAFKVKFNEVGEPKYLVAKFENTHYFHVGKYLLVPVVI